MKSLAHCLCVALFLGHACPSFAEIGDVNDVIPTPPEFVRVLKVDLGKDTVSKLERKIGKGFVTIGGHSDSGRSWGYSNGLHLHSDAFYFNQNNHAILDELVFLDWNGRLGDTKELKKYGFGIWGKLKRGMTQTECLKLLPKSLPKPVIKAEDISWRKHLRGVFRKQKGNFQYEALLRFNKGKLYSLILSSFFNNTKTTVQSTIDYAPQHRDKKIVRLLQMKQ